MTRIAPKQFTQRVVIHAAPHPDAPPHAIMLATKRGQLRLHKDVVPDPATLAAIQAALPDPAGFGTEADFLSSAAKAMRAVGVRASVVTIARE